jgi:hypothetical protein
VKRFALLLIVIFCALLPSQSECSTARFGPGYQITTLIEHSHLVVVGTVAAMEFVFREDVPPQYTTDIVIHIEEVIKGTPNYGEGGVKFMIPGGTGFNPKYGKVGTGKTEGFPEFRLNERVLLFLRKSKNRHPERFKHLPPPPIIPHDGLYISGRFGKIDIKYDEVAIPYTFKKEIFSEYHQKMRERTYTRSITLPLDLVIQIAKASTKDYDATKLLEENIKDYIDKTPIGSKPKLDEKLIDKLKAGAKRILEKAEDDQ